MWRFARLRLAPMSRYKFRGCLKAWSMANWFRLILSVLALVGLLAAGTGEALAATSHHPCCPEMTAAMTTGHHSAGNAGDHHGATPDCCMMGVCALMTPVSAPQAYVVEPKAYAQVLLPVANDAGTPSFSISPVLRPPIA